MTTTVRASARSAIQSSAASNASQTTTRSISGCSGTRMRGVADDLDRHLAPQGDLVDLVLHRTGVGIDEDLKVAHPPPLARPRKVG